jgi:hypothetical protein
MFSINFLKLQRLSSRGAMMAFSLSIRELGWLQLFLFPKYSFHLLLMKLLNSVFADVFVNSAVCPPGISTN